MNMRVKSALLALLLLLCLGLTSGCAGGMEIESCLFVLAMAVDPAPDGNLTVTIKALSGTQEATGGSVSSQNAGGEDEGAQASGSGDSGVEEPEPGYIVLSATSSSCLRALSLLSATTPRTVNLSQLREVVISRTLAETDATLTILKEIYAMYRANGAAVVVVTPDDAGDFIRRQRAVLGIRLSKYLEVLFEHYAELDFIPPNAQLASVIAAMESSTMDAAAVYAAGNSFDSPLTLNSETDIDRLPGHLPRTSPAENEYLGSAIFSGPRMTGVLTGQETFSLCLMMGQARTRTAFSDGVQYKPNVPTRVTRSIDPEDGALCIHIVMNLSVIAGTMDKTGAEIAQEVEQNAANVLLKLQAASCDVIGFGRIAIRSAADIPTWESLNWAQRYSDAPVRVTVDVKLL